MWPASMLRPLLDSFAGAVFRAASDFPSGKKGDVLTVEFTVVVVSSASNSTGGLRFGHNEAFCPTWGSHRQFRVRETGSY